jgi:hypothetical protein
MIQIQEFDPTKDSPALQKAIDGAVFHPGAWRLADFITTEEDAIGNPPKVVAVISDDRGPIAFTRYTKVLRICCVWNDEADYSRNAKAIIFGVKDAVNRARASGFSEIIIQSSNPKLANFLENVLKMKKSDGEFVYYV